MYRRPAAGNTKTMSIVNSELKELRSNVVGTIFIGEFICHHAQWLRHSFGISIEGRVHWFCMDNGLEQIVREPTRGPYLFALMLSDLGDTAKTFVLPEIADYGLVLAKFRFCMGTQPCRPRIVWYYCSADWSGLNNFCQKWISL